MLWRRLLRCLILMSVLVPVTVVAQPVVTQADPGDQNSTDVDQPPVISEPTGNPHFGSSPFEPPDPNDTTFVIDQAPGLDTGCTFRSGGPLIFDIEVDRFPGDVNKLLANGLISDSAVLRMPAFDVDFFGGGFTIGGVFVNPERDRVFFNGNVVPTEFLTGDNNIWKLNAFNVPIDWVNFPSDPGEGGTLTPAVNTIQIDIDTQHFPQEFWCTAIDWAALSINVAKPVLMVHGILSSGTTWSTPWVPNLTNLGLPHATINMGALDSIQNNAGKIATRVSSLRNRWGVDKLMIVAHSKGGIDSRHYIEANDTIAGLAQIGTPNAGSPLADAVQAGAIAGLGIVPTAIINTLAGPAGIQLTTLYMNTYNIFHSFNPNTVYLSLAGDYKFGGLGFWDAILSGFYGGANDTIVPVSSVHALNFAAHLTYSSTSANKQAQHTSQTSSTDIYNILQPFVTALDPPLPPSTSSNSSGITRTGTVVDMIMQGQTESHVLVMDGSLPIAFTLYHGTGDLDLLLVSPSGVRIDPGVAASDPDVEFVTFGDIDGLRFEAYAINNPETGQWILEVSAPSVVNPAGEEPYFLTGWLTDTSIQMSAETDQVFYKTADPLVISATLLDGGTPITGANAAAKVVLPDQSFSTVTLSDDGTGDDTTANDGIYSGRFSSTSQAGLYRLLVTGDKQGPTGFNRETLLFIPVSVSSSQFSGAFSDFGNDTDGDGLFDELVIDVGLNITDSARYRVLGTLVDSGGTSFATVVVDANLAPGLQTVSLRFDGSRIFQHGVDGPYNLSLVQLVEDDGFTTLPVDERLSAHTTASYSHNQFQRPPIFVPGTGSDQGIDTDGNSLFDLLEINLDVDVLNGGFYNWSARLVDVNGTEIDFATSSGFLSAGLNMAPFTFDGRAIGRNGIDGPYFLSDLLIFSSTDSAVIFQAYTVTGYQASQFEEFTPSNQPPTADAGLDHEILSGDTVTKNVTFNDPDGDDSPWEYTIDWDDGSTDSGSTNDQSVPIVASHQYFTPGEYTVEVCITDTHGATGCDSQVVTVRALFLLIDEDSIDDGAPAIVEVANALGMDPAQMVNDDIAGLGVRTPLGIPVGTIIGTTDVTGSGTANPFMTGQVGDEGWFALKTVPDTWDAAGPTTDGLRNFVLAGPGLGTDDDPEVLLDKIPDVTPLRTAGLEMLEGRGVCALVYDSDISTNYDPLNGSLKGANLGLIGFEVLSVGAPDGSVLPDVTIRIEDTDKMCNGPLALFSDAPVPISSSEPSP